MPTGAELITHALEDAGVEVVFGLPGVHNLPLWDAVRRSSIRLVGVRHEQAAAYAADGYARATGRVGVALTTTGPGAANTLGAVGEAWASRSPILVIATDIPSGLRREGVYRGVLHETDGQADMFRPVVDACCFGAAEIHAALAAARQPPHRPVYLEVPTDELSAPVDRPDREFDFEGDRSDPGDAAAELLAGAKRPLVWVGSGGRDAGQAIGELASRLCAPVLTTYGARGVLAPEHPCLVCLPPHAEPAGRLWDEADVVIGIGTDFDGMNTQNWLQPQPPKLIAVNLDRTDAEKNYDVDVTLVGGAAEVVADLAGRIEPRGGLQELASRLHHARSEACAGLDDRAMRFLDAISFALPDDAVVVADMCIPGYWIGGYHPFHHPRKLLYPVGWGTLGFAFPASLGAALAGTGPTVAICGDGGFLFACGELATVAQERIPLTTVIVDDGGYGMLRYDQDLAGSERFGVDLQTPDFEAMAAAFGIRAQTVEGLDDDFGAALAEHVLDGEPSVLVAKTEALIPPPTTSPNWYRKRSAQPQAR
jgi:acetolactate synthase-1/2/3 large subunit